ncbi:hypothetical protein K432DRAFT_45894 [Lepidopterella palustris CBS 459.81]|uniref:Uncharacterized protein n=1 Tax=Lepidopterella palustris CBS 459.81 TaxID=1314670 RepID=A0A8E2EB52_9PEZI|nr:hypothetical protein K432DRAFT_45894 [Lepidopterella palustris CBS 459.81]
MRRCDDATMRRCDDARHSGAAACLCCLLVLLACAACLCCLLVLLACAACLWCIPGSFSLALAFTRAVWSLVCFAIALLSSFGRRAASWRRNWLLFREHPAQILQSMSPWHRQFRARRKTSAVVMSLYILLASDCVVHIEDRANHQLHQPAKPRSTNGVLLHCEGHSV